MRTFVVALVASVAAGVAMPVPAQADPSVADQHQLLPLYVYPSWWDGGNAWIQACAGSNPSGDGSTMIANLGSDSAGNPGGGASTAYNIDLGTVVAYCAERGNDVVGYVDTDYGTRPLADVYADIDAWYARYDGTTDIYDIGTVDDPLGETAQISGIFLDQVSITPSGASVEPGRDIAAYYRAVHDHILAAAPADREQIVVNPGAPPVTNGTYAADWMLAAPTRIATTVVLFEGPVAGGAGWGWEDYVPPTWVRDYAATQFAMMFFGVPVEDVDTVCGYTRDNHAGNVAVTPYTITPTATPWNFWAGADYLAEIRRHCG
jgi:hypothetical protein